ncbi:MAG: hypothetical protein JJE51_13790 [Thermoanaerobaculia bacterium]|nr:hypothetical protein [Thermoanaerobaculia bacterium]
MKRVVAPTGDADVLEAFARLCREGRIYDVERWIMDAKPIHAVSYSRRGSRRIKNALEVAVDTDRLDLGLLLLCNGFPPDAGGESLLDLAIRDRKREFVDLLLTWGADPLLADAYTVLASYDADLYERFWNFGLDFTRGHALARILADQSSNRPGYGWARLHNAEPKIARELAIALLEAVVENRERAAALLMWAGADPRKPVPDLRYSREDDLEEEDTWSTAMVHALMYGHGHLLKILKPQLARDDFDMLWTWACDEAAVDHLAKLKPPDDWSKVLLRNLERALSSYRGDEPRKLIEKLTVEHDARVTEMTESEIAGLRRELLRCPDDSKSRWVLRWLSYSETCEPAVFAELTRTAAVQRKLNSLHIRDARYRY